MLFSPPVCTPPPHTNALGVQGDKGKGKQNKWIEYDASIAAKLEARWNKPGPKGKKLGQVMTDSERFVDLDRMMQGRKDDTTRVITPLCCRVV